MPEAVDSDVNAFRSLNSKFRHCPMHARPHDVIGQVGFALRVGEQVAVYVRLVVFREQLGHADWSCAIVTLRGAFLGCCEFSAAFHGRPNERVVQYHHARSNSAPKNSLQRRAIPQSLDQYSGDICALPASGSALSTQGVNMMRLHSLRTVVLFGLVALALLANGRKAIAAAHTAPPASPTVALSASPASAQAGQPVTLKWSSTNATSITLEPSVGPVAVKGSTTVRPSQSTTYPLTATGPGGSAHASAQVTITPAPPQAGVQKPSEKDISSDQEQMRGLDEQIQEIKSDSRRMSAELSQLEEKLLYPSGTQVAIFVELAKGDAMRLDAVRLQIDGQLVAHYIYSA